MRYKVWSPTPRYLGGVDEFDIYVTPMGAFIARYGSKTDNFIRLASHPYTTVGVEARERINRPTMRKREAVAERIDAMIRCFAHDLCAED
jgi:hypothetical protein